jgi:hypothetical protein
MSTFERDEYKWRETYFVLFDSSRRPLLKTVEEALCALSDRFQLSNALADEDGRFESITVMSPDDYAALDISYLSGEEVLEQTAALEKEFKAGPLDAEERAKVERIKRCDARFDLLHFEQTTDEGPGDEADEMLDPSMLLIVLDAMVDMTEGIGVDPQSGTLL